MIPETAIERLTELRDSGAICRHDWMQLKRIIEVQNADIDNHLKLNGELVDKMAEYGKRLSELEEDCPDCKDGQVFGGISTGATEPCSACQGSGKVPICYLPDGFMTPFRMMVVQFEDKMSEEICKVTKDKVIFGSCIFSKQPNNLWKLEAKS